MLKWNIVVRMPGEMHAALNKVFTPRHSKEPQLPQKNLTFLEKISGLLFFRFYDCGPFEGGPGQMS